MYFRRNFKSLIILINNHKTTDINIKHSYVVISIFTYNVNPIANRVQMNHRAMTLRPAIHGFRRLTCRHVHK